MVGDSVGTKEVSHWYPDDLSGKTDKEVAQDLFGITPSMWWHLERATGNSFNWHELRFGEAWRATHGFLVGLHEVGSSESAKQFASRNKITLFDGGGLYYRNRAEFLIQCALPPKELLTGLEDLFQIQDVSGMCANVGYSSLLFQRLVASPAAEENGNLPDPTAMRTVILQGVEKSEVHQAAEVVLYHLREYFGKDHFRFCNIGELRGLSDLDDESDSRVDPRLVEQLPQFSHREAIAFMNRAEEADAITAFLYYYRVLEACFDAVLEQQIATWRGDPKIDSLGLLKNFRKLQQREDVSSLRRVVGKLVDQQILDQACSAGLILSSTAEALCNGIYNRRNSIAHGRRGQHNQVLVPYAFYTDHEPSHLAWRDLAGNLATLAVKEWLVH